ncbi:SwmB domain-containing protein, partial [Verminephrobacter aporrectodeae]|uniref:SwmB domain-containing protein n=1 Tax=Verminephrobacter aporrectodeae TaxID=1110389 RepID=UPI00224455AC
MATSPAATTTTPGTNSELNVTIAIADRALTADETTTVTFTFTRPVNGFDTRDITCANGTLSALTPDANRTVWTATFTPTANTNAPSNVINVDLAGVTDNAGNAGAGEVTSANYSVDTRDTVAPLFLSATVNADQLVLTYTEANTLDPAALSGSAGFTVSSTGTAITVSSAVVNATAKTVTLTLSRAVTSSETVSVSYTKPTSGAVVQDAAGNDAADLSSQTVTNNTPNPAAPQLITTADDRPQVREQENVLLQFSHQENPFDTSHGPAKTDFTVLVDGVPNVVTDIVMGDTSAATLLTLILTTPVQHGQKVTVSYRDSTLNDGNGIRDTAGNSLNSILTTEVVNKLEDRRAPELITTGDTRRPKVTGDQLVLSYEDSSNLQGRTFADNAGFTVSTTAGTTITVTGAVVNSTAKTVTLTLSRAVTHEETVSVSYTRPAAGHTVQDTANNGADDFRNQAVTNNTPAAADTTAPVINTAVVNGDQLVLTYTEASILGLDATHTAPATAYAVSSASGPAISVNGVTVNAADKTVTLALSRAVDRNEVVSV